MLAAGHQPLAVCYLCSQKSLALPSSLVTDTDSWSWVISLLSFLRLPMHTDVEFPTEPHRGRASHLNNPQVVTLPLRPQHMEGLCCPGRADRRNPFSKILHLSQEVSHGIKFLSFSHQCHIRSKSGTMFYILKCIQGSSSHISNFRVPLKYSCYQI